MEAHDVRLVHLHLRLDHREIGDRHQQADVFGERTRNRDLAFLDREPGHAPGHRGDEVRLAEVVARLLHGGARLVYLVLRRGQVRLGDFEGGLRLLQLLGCHEVGTLVPQLPGAPEGPLRLVAVRPRLHYLGGGGRVGGLGALQVGLVHRGVDLEQELALRH